MAEPEETCIKAFNLTNRRIFRTLNIVDSNLRRKRQEARTARSRWLRKQFKNDIPYLEKKLLDVFLNLLPRVCMPIRRGRVTFFMKPFTDFSASLVFLTPSGTPMTFAQLQTTPFCDLFVTFDVPDRPDLVRVFEEHSADVEFKEKIDEISIRCHWFVLDTDPHMLTMVYFDDKNTLTSARMVLNRLSFQIIDDPARALTPGVTRSWRSLTRTLNSFEGSLNFEILVFF